MVRAVRETPEKLATRRAPPETVRMIFELINTGSELMLGRVLNTHQQWLCRQLADLGWLVSRQVAIPDDGPAIQTATREALARADVVIATGGLGPTSDDITRDLIAQLLGKKLVEDPAVLAHISSFFEARKRPMPERVRVQALVPEGAIVLSNDYGTAPGLAMEIKSNLFRSSAQPAWLVMLPGPPRELRPMFHDQLLPLFRRVLPRPDAFVCRTLRVTGLGESLVEEKVAGPLQSLVGAGLQLGYCARPGQVDLRLVGQGPKAAEIVKEAQAIVRHALNNHIYADADEELESVIVRLMTEKKKTLALAESCTGGCIANRLTDVPGASAVLLAGIVSYSNQAKEKFLGVDSQTLTAHGAVSEPVAREMAEGVRQRTNADYALSVTGIAGPGGGTPGKPVGTVFIGLAGPFKTIVIKNLNPWDRETFKQVTAQQSLELLRRKIATDSAR
jgi:nicotinamide-nucleotide amidase